MLIFWLHSIHSIYYTETFILAHETAGNSKSEICRADRIGTPSGTDVMVTYKFLF